MKDDGNLYKMAAVEVVEVAERWICSENGPREFTDGSNMGLYATDELLSSTSETNHVLANRN